MLAMQAHIKFEIMRKTITATISVLTTAMAVLAFVWTHWRLIVSLRSFPKLPDNWKDAEQVRIFFVALMRSDVAHELTKLLPIRWGDNSRLILAVLADSPTLWNIAWDFANGIDHSDSTRRETIRGRIRDRLSQMFRQTSAMPAHAEDVEELVAAIQATKLVFRKSSQT
jgi:hypothetical protein